MGRMITEPQRDWLAGELDAWREAGVVTADQMKAVLGLYATPREVIDSRQSNALGTVVALATLLIGLGVLLLIGYNWEAMPSALKVAVIFAALLASHAAGLLARYRLGYRGVAEAAFLFGCLLYGAGIWLIAQIFHINAGTADGYWWWALGVLPFALAMETLVLHTLFVGLLAVWVGFEAFGSTGAGFWLFGWLPGAAHGGYSLLPLAAPGLAWAYRQKSDKAVALYVPLIAWWVILQPFAWRFEVNPSYFIGAVGGLLLLAAEAHPVGSALAIPYRFYGAGLIAGALVPLSYYAVNVGGGRVWKTAPDQGVYLTIAIAVLAALGLAAVAALRRRARREAVPLAAEVGEIARRQWLPCGMIALMAGLSLYGAAGGEAVLPTVAANAAMVVLAFWLMQVGLRDDRGRPFAAGVIYFLFWAVLRYIDLFGAFGGMLGAALVFFLCGLTLFGVAHYWHRRKAAQHD